MEDLEYVWKAVQQLRADISEMEGRSEELEHKNTLLRQDNNRMNSEISRYDLLNQELREDIQSNEKHREIVQELMEEEKAKMTALADYLHNFEGTLTEIQNHVSSSAELLRPAKIAQIQLDKEITWRQMKVGELKAKAAEEEQKAKDVKYKYGELQNELDSLLKQKNTLREQDCASKAEIFELSNQLHQLEIEEETQKKELEQENNQLKELEELKTDLEKKLSTNIQVTNEEVKGLVEQVDSLSSKIEELEKDLTSKKLKTQSTEKDFENVHASILDTMKQIEELQLKFERDQVSWPSELEKLNVEIAKLENQNSEIQAEFLKEIETLSRNLENQRESNRKLEYSVEETGTKLKENQLKIEDNKTTVLEIAQQKEVLYQKIDESKLRFETQCKELNEKEVELRQKIADSKGKFSNKKEDLLKEICDLKSNKDRCQSILIPELQQQVTKVEEEIQTNKSMLLEFELKRKEGLKLLSELLERNKTKIEEQQAKVSEVETKACFQDVDFDLELSSLTDQIENTNLETLESEAFLNLIGEEADQLSYQIEICESNVAEVQSSTQALREEIVNRKNIAKEQHLNEAQVKLAQLQNENKILSSNVDDLKEKIQSAQSEKEKLQTEIKTKTEEIAEIESSVTTVETRYHDTRKVLEDGHINLKNQLLEYEKLKYEKDRLVDDKKAALCALEEDVELQNAASAKQRKSNQNKEQELEENIVEAQRKVECLESDLRNLEEKNKRSMEKKANIERSIEELREKRQKTSVKLDQPKSLSQKSVNQQSQKSLSSGANTLLSSSSQRTPSFSEKSTVLLPTFKEPKKTLKASRAKTAKKVTKKAQSILTYSPITPQREVMVITDDESEDKEEEQKRKPRMTAEIANSRIRSVFSETSVDEPEPKNEPYKKQLFRSPLVTEKSEIKEPFKAQSLLVAPPKKNHAQKEVWDLSVTDTSIDEEPQTTYSIAPVKASTKSVSGKPTAQYSKKKTSTSGLPPLPKNPKIFSDTSLEDQDSPDRQAEIKEIKEEVPTTQKVEVKGKGKKFFKSKELNTKKIYGKVIQIE